jgi:glycyl-tRNA synthetase beta subunit
VATQQTPEERVVRGPAKRACFDAQGNPTQALIGFARSRGVEPDAVQFQETPQGEYAFVREYDSGQPAVEVLADALPKLILSMTFPKDAALGQPQDALRTPHPLDCRPAGADGHPI